MKLKDVKTPEIEESLKVIDEKINEYTEKIKYVSKVIETDCESKDDKAYALTFMNRRDAYIAIKTSYEIDKRILTEELEKRRAPKPAQEKPKNWFVFVSIA